ncbi:hypothetical protein V7127_02620 [Bacillus sp. JJ1773]|uniref:hypothetical protein n=1 Tax=Bacillus sp. JJ1773 TaxID=3122965 RepID=UPI002FFDF2D0
MIKFDSVQILLDDNSPLSEEILRNSRIILTTFEGTVPFDRGFGINPDIIDLPTNEAQDLYTVESVTKLRMFEPRVTVQDVSFRSDTNGGFYPRVVLAIAES